jgi:PAS domain S-box-containing protein
MEFRMRHKDGSYRWIRSRAFILRDATGRVYRKAGSHEDITDRKIAEEELRKSRERFELAVLASQDGQWDWDVESDQVWYSARMRDMLGYEEQEFPNQPGETERRVHPDDHARWKANLQSHVAGGPDHREIEYRMLHKDGSYRWVRDQGVALRRADGKAYRIAGSREDITERKSAEEELAYERYLLRSLMDTSPDFIVFKDREGRYIRANPTFIAKLGLGDPAQVIGKTVHDLFETDYARASDAEEQEIIRTGQPVVAKDVTITWADGRATWGSVTKVPLRDPQNHIIGTFAIARDITERKQAEEELAHERHLLHTLLDNLPDAIYFKDAAGRFLRVNKAVAVRLGLVDPRQVVGKTHFDFFPEENARATMVDDQEIMRTGRPLVGQDETISWPDGRQGWLSTTKMPFRDRDGNVIGVFGVSRDITPRKQAEIALRKSEERYRSVIAAMRDGILILDADGGIQSCNAAAERILGLSAEQMMGRTSLEPGWRAIHEDGSPFPTETFPAMTTLRTGRPCTDVIMGVHQPDGTLTWITVNSQPLLQEDGKTLAGAVVSFKDISERKRIEERLRQCLTHSATQPSNRIS